LSMRFESAARSISGSFRIREISITVAHCSGWEFFGMGVPLEGVPHSGAGPVPPTRGEGYQRRGIAAHSRREKS
jgi:hypothetical protein